MRNPLSKITTFFSQTIWEKKVKNSVAKNFLHRWLRIIISSSQSFIDDNNFNKASTLTFYTLLSIIPFLAICFGIAQIFGFAEIFSELVKKEFQDQPRVAEKLIQFSNSTLKTTKGGVIASLGVLVIFWTVLQTIASVEAFFNEIWRVKKTRTYWQEIKRYIPLILLLPILISMLSSMVVFMSQKAHDILRTSNSFEFLNPVILLALKFVSYGISWIFLSFIYIYLPNIKVLLRTGLIAGIITLIIFLAWQWIYINFQLHATSYGAIYGSFAAVPLFLIWLNYSWLIILFGAELSHQIQEEFSKK